MKQQNNRKEKCYIRLYWAYKQNNLKEWICLHLSICESILFYSPVVIDGIKGDGVFSVLCLGVTVVNGALILMTVGRSNLCNRTLPLSIRKKIGHKKMKIEWKCLHSWGCGRERDMGQQNRRWWEEKKVGNIKYITNVNLIGNIRLPS